MLPTLLAFHKDLETWLRSSARDTFLRFTVNWLMAAVYILDVSIDFKGFYCFHFLFSFGIVKTQSPWLRWAAIEIENNK